MAKNYPIGGMDGLIPGEAVVGGKIVKSSPVAFPRPKKQVKSTTTKGVYHKSGRAKLKKKSSPMK